MATCHSSTDPPMCVSDHLVINAVTEFFWKPWEFVSTKDVSGVSEARQHHDRNLCDTVDGRNPAPVDMVNILIPGFMHPRWCRISSINSIILIHSVIPKLNLNDI